MEAFPPLNSGPLLENFLGGVGVAFADKKWVWPATLKPGQLIYASFE